MAGDRQESADAGAPRDRDHVLQRHLAPLGEDNERFVFLAEATTAITASLDVETTLHALANVVVPALADWASVSVLEDDGSIRRACVTVANQAKRPLADRLAEGYPTDPAASTGVAAVIRTGESQLLEQVTEQLLVETAHNDEYLAITLALGFRSAMLVPLEARGHILGEITLVCGESGRTYSEADLMFAEELARRAALALDNARLHQEVVRQRGRYEELVNSVRAIVWEATPGVPHYDFVSDPAVDLLGYPIERWLREDGFFWTMLHPDDHSRVEEVEQQVKASGSSHVVEYRLFDTRGAVHWMRDQLSVERAASGEPVLLRGVMVDITEQHEREEALRSLAATLQASLLPPQEPTVDGLEVAARYRPSERVAGTVGGDFYDLFPLGDGIAGAVVGDVCGKGVEAAALTALARYTLRSAAVQAGEPVAVLTQVNRILLDDASLGERFATAVFIVVDTAPRPARATLGVAGHVPPFVLRETGQVEILRAAGQPLGLFEDAHFESLMTTLGPEDCVVLVTDGVTEAQNAAGDLFGQERVRGVLEGVAGEDADVVADALIERVRSFAGGPLRDDAAVLVLRVPA